MAVTIESARDKVKKKQALLRKAEDALEAVKKSETEKQIVALKAELKSLEDLIAEQKSLIEVLVSKNAGKAKIEAEKTILENYESDKATRSNVLTALTTKVALRASILETSSSLSASSAAGKVTTTALGSYGSGSSQKIGVLEYNASGVKESYFSSTRAYQDLMRHYNQPSAVKAASDLWTSAAGSKGMIVTSEQVLKAWNSGSNPPATSNQFDTHNYGFQFQYNPGTVGMSYFTSPNVDVAMMTSGMEMFNLAGTSGSQGGVSFQIIINRIADMQYYSKAGLIKPGLDSRKIYSKPPSSVQEQKDVYNKGTMYDVEYLLRVLMGTTMKSYLRGDNTADMGWLPAIPVELHLGKTLRYLGTVNNVSLNHIIFNEKMVPLFTTLDIGFARLPDYPPGVSGTGVSA